MQYSHRWPLVLGGVALALLARTPLAAQTPSLQRVIQIMGSGAEGVREIAEDPQGNVILCGTFASSVDFDPGAGAATLTPADSQDVFVASYDSNGNYRWAIAIGGGGNDAPTKLAVDRGGNVIVRGSIARSADVDPGAGTLMIPSTGTAGATFVVKLSPTGTLLWGFGLPIRPAGHGLAVDSSGNVVVTGDFTGTVDFDPGIRRRSLSATASASGAPDLFVAKYTALGALSWAFRVGGSDREVADAAAIDAAGNVYVTGSFGRSGGSAVNFNPGSGGKVNLTTQGEADMFVARYTSAGRLSWAFAAGGTGPDRGWSISTDGMSLAVSGTFAGSGDFDPSSATATLSSNSTQDLFVARYTTAGSLEWSFGLGPTCQCLGAYGANVAIDDNGDLHVSGNFRDAIDFDPGPGSATLTSEAGTQYNGFVAEYGADGQYRSAFILASASRSVVPSLAISRDHLYVGGFFQGTVDVDPADNSSVLTSAGGYDGFGAIYSRSSLPKPSSARGESNPLRTAPLLRLDLR